MGVLSTDLTGMVTPAPGTADAASEVDDEETGLAGDLEASPRL